MTGQQQDQFDEKALPEGPVVDDACVQYADCGRPQAEHRTSFMDTRAGVIGHDYKAPPPRPYPHEVVPCMIRTEWYCHACGTPNDVWGTGADEGYMQCSNTECLAWSWLNFNPHGFEECEAAAVRSSPGAGR